MSRGRAALIGLIVLTLILLALDRLAVQRARRALAATAHAAPHASTSVPRGTGRSAATRLAGGSSDAAPEPPAPAEEDASPTGLGGVLGAVVEGATAAVDTYGACRAEGSWPLKLQRDRGLARLQEPGLSDDERAAAEEEVRVASSVLSGPGIGTLFAFCGALGPSEPPPELLADP